VTAHAEKGITLMYPNSTATLPFPAITDPAEVTGFVQRLTAAQVGTFTALGALTASLWTTAVMAPFAWTEQAARLMQLDVAKPDAYRHQPDS
jgi:hypothetical protein